MRNVTAGDFFQMKQKEKSRRKRTACERTKIRVDWRKRNKKKDNKKRGKERELGPR